YANKDKLKKEQGKERKTSILLGADRGNVPPPLPTAPHPEVSVAEKPVSTFSLKVSDVSFRLAEASIKQGQWPAKAIIRSEEFVNSFDYDDPLPAAGESLAFRMERASHPFTNNREVLRFSLSAAPAEDEKTRPLNLVIALDNSDSMKRGNRLNLAKKTLHGLAKHLTGSDRVSLVTFARQAKLQLSSLPGDEFSKSIDEISPSGSEEETNLEEALDLSYATARKRYFQKGNNRVLLLSDGGANLDARDPRTLKAKVDEQRSRGIALDCIGLGSEGFVDHMLEAISRNGRYVFLNNLGEADDAFGGKLAGILRPAVTDLKVQIEFNPERVGLYRQIGFEKHRLEKQYFDENSIAGGEIANGETGNALYVVRVNPKGKGDLGVLRVRYREPKTDKLKQGEWRLAYEREAPAFANASPSMRLAVYAATFAEWLTDHPQSTGFVIEQAVGDLQTIRSDFPDKASIDRLSEMVIRSRAISR
ncbi:MAG: von Willebrand factor type A domain-containing protein, partial [Opitutales bacterium]